MEFMMKPSTMDKFHFPVQEPSQLSCFFLSFTSHVKKGKGDLFLVLCYFLQHFSSAYMAIIIAMMTSTISIRM